jgi:hypothetical protein
LEVFIEEMIDHESESWKSNQRSRTCNPRFCAARALLISGGAAFGMLLPNALTPGGWFTGVVLLLFALFVQITRRSAKRETCPPDQYKTLPAMGEFFVPSAYDKGGRK